MTKVLAVLAIVVVIFGGYKLWEVWDQYDKNKDVEAAEAAKRETKGETLPGMPWELRESLETAQKNGAASLKNWLKNNNAVLQDPRRAWVELDYMVLVAKDDPAEAKKIFSMVSGRVGTNSPVYSRVQQLRSTYGN